MKFKPCKELVLPKFDFRVLKYFKEWRTYVYYSFIMYSPCLVDMFVLDKLFPSSVQEQSDALQLSDALKHYPLLLLLAGGIFAPFLKSLFSVVFFFVFSKRSLPFWTAVILSSLIFGIAHTYSVGIMVSTFMTGIFAMFIVQTN